MNAVKPTLVANAVAFVLLVWLYGGDLADYRRAKWATVSALTELPNAPLAIAAVVLALGAAGVAVYGLLRRRGPDFKGYRLLPIAAVAVLFVDLFVLAGERLPVGSAEQLAMALRVFERRASELATPEGVPDDARALGELVKELGRPPYLVRGERAQSYRLQLRTGCQGPVSEAPGAEVGTILYCVSADRRMAWVTAMGLPAEQTFGEPRVFSVGGKPYVAVLTAGLAEPEGERALPDGGTSDGIPDG